jgi:hypothetical protein
MKRHHPIFPSLGVLAVVIVIVSACNSNQSVIKSKPTSVPTVTDASCQQLLSLAEVNRIFQPASPAIAVSSLNFESPQGICLYKSTQAEVMALSFTTFIGGSLSTIATNNRAGTITTSHAITGVGDQAYFVADTLTDKAITKDYEFYVADGSISFDLGAPTINNLGGIGDIPDATAESRLKAAALLIVNRL